MNFLEERKFMYLEIGMYFNSLLHLVFLKVNKNNNYKKLLMIIYNIKKIIIIKINKELKKNKINKFKILSLKELLSPDY
jgi:hypothetical protein